MGLRSRVVHLIGRHAGNSGKKGATLIEPDLLDAELIARLARGDEAAIGPLYDRYAKLVYSLAMRIVHDGPTAEDLTQEVFVRLWRSAASFDPQRGHLRGWLLRIAHNLALNELRRRGSRPVAAAPVEGLSDDASLEDQDVLSNPETVAEQRDVHRVVQRALGQLPETQRQALELAFFQGLSQTEIATATGDPLGTVKSRVRNGMKRLRELLIAAGLDPGEFADSS
jgi:RNA polymerase sigma-70 factor (ECF subfamily)